MRSWTSLAVARAARAARPKAYFIVNDKKGACLFGEILLLWVWSSKKMVFSKDIYVEEREVVLRCVKGQVVVDS